MRDSGSETVGIILRDGQLLVRLVVDSDAPLLARWLSDPRVLEYYEGRDCPYDLAMVQADYLNSEDDPEIRCLVEHGGRPIGYVQFYPLEPEARLEYGYAESEAIYGLDLFLGEPDCWGRGIGTRLLTALAGYLFAALGADCLVLDPQVSNLRAIRCYEKAGFRKVRLLPQHERHEGAPRDCWLMCRKRGHGWGSAHPLLSPRVGGTRGG